MKHYCHSGIRARRFKTPDFSDPVPDLVLEDGKFSINPEWEAAEYEEAFFDKNKKPLKAKTLYGAIREMREKDS